MLLTDDDPAPFEVLNPDGESDFVLTADHAGRAIPAALGDLGVPASEMERHIAWDIGIAEVTRHMARLLDAPAILQTYSRLVIDCNRDPSWPSAMPEVSEFTPVPGNVGLTEAQRADRVAAIFTPYHARIGA
jgi:predicted N-formylglutamate amidohydrolase